MNQPAGIQNSLPTIEAAESLRELGQLEQAEKMYRGVLEQTPGHFGALMGLGKLLRQRGDHGGALGAFEAAIASNARDSWPKIEAAKELVDLSRLEEAEAMYLQVKADTPGYARALFGLGQLFRQCGNPKAALESFEAAVAADPSDPWAKIEAGRELRDLGRLDDAEMMYRRVIANSPGHMRALMGLGYVQRLRGDRVISLASFTAAADANPTDLWPKMEAAEDLRQLGRLDEAEAMFRSVIAAAPRHQRALMGLSYVRRQRGDHAGSLASIEQAILSEPRDPWPKIEAAQELRELKRFDEAETMYQSALIDAPGNVRALKGLGHLLRQRGDYAAALKSFEAAIASDPRDPWAKIDAAQQLRQLGRFDEAEATFRKVLEGTPTQLQALLALGYLFLDRFCWAEAEKLFRRAIEAAPASPAGLLGLAHVARLKGDAKGALAYFQSAAAIDPANIEAKLEFAAELRNQGQFDQAREIIDTALDAEPNRTDALIQRGVLFRQQGERRVALEAFKNALKSDPYNVQVIVELAVEHRVLGEVHNSDSLLRAALERDPNSLAALMQAAENARLAEDVETTLALLRRAIAAHPHSIWPYLAASEAAQEMGRLQESTKFLSDAQEKFSTHPEIWAKQVEALRLSRNWKAAREKIDEAPDVIKRYFSIWSQFVQIAIATGEFAAAESALQNPPAASFSDLSRVYLHRGQLAEARWNLTEALSHYEKAAGTNPNDNWPHYEAARVCVKIPNPEGIRDHLRDYIRLNASVNLSRGQSTNLSQSLIGQLLDEFIFDKELLGELLRIRGLPLERQLSPLEKLVQKDPDHTPSAIILLTAMRQSGRFDSKKSGRTSKGVPRIPRRIIQFWDSPKPPPELRELMAIWPSMQPDFEYVLFNDNSAQQFIATHFPPPVANAFVRIKEPAQRADLFRLAYLSAMGGYYVDADDRCLARIDSNIPDQTALCLYQEDFGSIGNNFLGAVPRHAIIELALALAVTAINRGDSDIPWLCTGPGLITRAFAQATTDRKVSGAMDGVIVLDLWELQRFVGLHSVLAYKKTEGHWLRSIFKQPAIPTSTERRSE